MRKFLLVFVFFLAIFQLKAQTKWFPIPGAVEIPGSHINGKIDDVTDFATCTQVPFIMPDGTKLQTDIFLPILQDSFVYKDTFQFQLLPAPFPPIKIPIFAVLLQKGNQFIIYDTINGHPNPNPFQLPMILERTPYDKEDKLEGSAMSLLGYAGAKQDMRGRYTSEGAYLPLYSDSWKKWPYHQYKHILDITDLSDPRNGNNHEDGYNTIEFVKNSLVRNYDLNGDGIMDTVDLVYNGSIGTFGASALGYNQLQAAAAHRIDPNKPGLKSMFPIVGPLEFYKSTGFWNGCLRDGLVTGWLRGQIKDTRDDLYDQDMGLNDNIHSSKDYGTPDKFAASNLAIDHFVTVRYEGSPCGYYPNSLGRGDMDASHAPVDSAGEGDKNGQFSRYTNINVPAFLVSGWWDIFVDGSIETTQRIQANITGRNKVLQKIVVGPWAHQTIASTHTGDKTYPHNVTDITRIDISNLGSGGGLNVADIAQSELISWFRYNLNYNGYNKLGEPKVLLAKSTTWQTPLPTLPQLKVRFPSEDYKIPFATLLNFILGADNLKQVPVEIKLDATVFPLKIDLPNLGPLLTDFGSNGRFNGIPQVDYPTVPTYRYYVVGASSDDGSVSYAGNYWFGSEEFPPSNSQFYDMYLHANATANFVKPTTDEGYRTYVHDPDNPIITVGGGNMLERTPQGDRDAQGQMNLADTNFARYTMDREGVIKFETGVLPDSLCIIGFPKMKLYAKSNPGNATSGPTDCDFFVRILDVYPDGKEFFVVEGSVNARAREYARSLAEGAENDNAPFSNIDIGKIYEYYFKFYPIAYTFAQGHKIKVLISSSNYPRFQSCANVPLMPNEFFRRKPADGRTYIYNGVEYAPRVSVQRVAFSDQYPTHIELPVFGSTAVITAVKKPNSVKPDFDMNLYPNPSDGKFSLYINKNGKYSATIYNAIGEKMMVKEVGDAEVFDMTAFAKGQYVLELMDLKNTDQKLVKSFTIN